MRKHTPSTVERWVPADDPRLPRHRLPHQTACFPALRSRLASSCHLTSPQTSSCLIQLTRSAGARQAEAEAARMRQGPRAALSRLARRPALPAALFLRQPPHPANSSPPRAPLALPPPRHRALLHRRAPTARCAHHPEPRGAPRPLRSRQQGLPTRRTGHEAAPSSSPPRHPSSAFSSHLPAHRRGCFPLTVRPARRPSPAAHRSMMDPEGPTRAVACPAATRKGRKERTKEGGRGLTAEPARLRHSARRQKEPRPRAASRGASKWRRRRTATGRSGRGRRAPGAGARAEWWTA